MEKPKILILSGIPTSGKSTFRAKYEALGWSVISRDDLRNDGWGHSYKYTPESENKITEYCKKKFELYTLMHDNIIIDNSHVKEKYLNQWIKHIPEAYEYEIIFFDIPLWKAHIRNVKRWIFTGRWIPWSVLHQMKRNYDKIDKKKYEIRKNKIS